MIYYMFGPFVREVFDYPEIGCHSGGSYMDTRLQSMQNADVAFSFDGDRTIYFKNRYSGRTGQGFQYTEEEKIVIALKARPM